MCARWTFFNTPLAHVIPATGDAAGRLKGSLLCVAQDGTIAVLDVDGFQLYANSRLLFYTLLTLYPFLDSMYLIPASMYPLLRVCIGGDNLLLIYGDRHARLWDVRTREFWRAMTVDKADEMVHQGGWAEWWVVPYRLCTLSDDPIRYLDRLPNKSPVISGLDASLHSFDSGVQ